MITLHACAACGHTVFPARRLCHRCGGAAWTEFPCHRGQVTALTTVQTTVLAEVLTPPGVRVVTRLACAVPPGASVALHENEDGAVWGSVD